MGITQMELAQRYAGALGARAAWFVRAKHTVDVLAKMGLIALHDRLVVCAEEFDGTFEALFPVHDVVHAADSSPRAFLQASMDDPHGEKARLIPEGSPASYAHPAGIHANRLYWFVESEGGLGLRVAHIRALAEAAAAVGAILIVDNTVPSLFGCNPLSLGAHISLEALDRVAAGALSQKVVAVAVARSVQGKGRRRLVSPKAEDAYRLLAFSLGVPDEPSASLAIDDADLAAIVSGLDTLPERMQRHSDHAHAIAEYLACHPQVGHVFYPGLKSHPDRALAPNVLLHGFGPAIDFALQGDHERSMREQHQAFIELCPAAHRAAPAGGAQTRMGLVERRDLCYIRLFAGVDDPLSIVDSLDQAMRLFCDPPHA